ncbi:MAG: dinitrogenase iron-molybdenum cofactor biosynthesis protein [Candidatus Aegiribacteria sp.]|nr:dinitrogenase iron-molybdenum cofactor biosynthesis protein [Candidatus Aegiribacteria sp.]
MKVIVSSTGKSVDDAISTVFGRTEFYLLVDTKDFSSESFDNPALNQSSGAGIQAAQFVLKKNPGSVISSSIGPNAYEVLSAGSVPCYTATGGTVRETVEAFNRGELPMMGTANADSHSGMAGNASGPSENIGDKENELEILSARLRDLRGQIAEILQQLDRIKGEEI